jgi:thiol-disulfide isomerase/thioredoxin
MALTYTPAGELDSNCPDFSLKSVDGKSYSRKDFANAKATVILFICNHCPYVKAIEDRMIALAHEYSRKGVVFVGVCSNDAADHPDDRPEELFKRWKAKHYDFPYLVDIDQTMARDFGAVCTPDIYVYDSKHKLSYRGRLDDSWRDPAHVQRQELREALDRILQNLPVTGTQNPSMGCSIKWKLSD